MAFLHFLEIFYPGSWKKRNFLKKNKILQGQLMYSLKYEALLENI